VAAIVDPLCVLFVCATCVENGDRIGPIGGTRYAYSHESRDVNNARRALYIHFFMFVYTRYNIIMVPSNYYTQHAQTWIISNIYFYLFLHFPGSEQVQSLNCLKTTQALDWELRRLFKWVTTWPSLGLIQLFVKTEIFRRWHFLMY